MGAVVSRLGSGISFVTPSAIKGLVKRAGLPLEVDDVDQDVLAQQLKEPSKPPPPSAYTQPYAAQGFFTGVRSSITIKRSPSLVYESLSRDLHNVFGPITECLDTVEDDDGRGQQTIFRIVRIPFRVVCVSGNLKMRLRVEQDCRTRKIQFTSLKEGTLISKFLANFEITGDAAGHTRVHLDARISAKALPPPPFKGVVKGLMIHKIDCCMLDLLAYHEAAAKEEREHGFKPWAAAAAILARAGSFGEQLPEQSALQQHPDALRHKRRPSLRSHPTQD